MTSAEDALPLLLYRQANFPPVNPTPLGDQADVLMPQAQFVPPATGWRQELAEDDSHSVHYENADETATGWSQELAVDDSHSVHYANADETATGWSQELAVDDSHSVHYANADETATGWSQELAVDDSHSVHDEAATGSQKQEVDEDNEIDVEYDNITYCEGKSSPIDPLRDS